MTQMVKNHRISHDPPPGTVAFRLSGGVMADLIQGNLYRVITDTHGIVVDRELSYIGTEPFNEDFNYVFDSRRVVDGEMIGGTVWLNQADVVSIEPV